MTRWVTEEERAKAEEIDILTYMETYERTNLIHFSGDYYTTVEHDSMVINYKGWYRNSNSTFGFNALSYLQLVRGMKLNEAVLLLIGDNFNTTKKIGKERSIKGENNKKEPLIMPRLSFNTKIVSDYLVNQRKIDKGIVAWCFNHRVLFEGYKYHNALFVGYEKSKTLKCIEQVGTNKHKKFKGLLKNSDKRHTFKILPNKKSKDLYIFECAIDLLSYATFLKINGEDWQSINYLSMAGVYKSNEYSKNMELPKPLKEYLKNSPQLENIYVGFDNDSVGQGAFKLIKLTLDCGVYDLSPPNKNIKDWNDFLKNLVKEKNKKIEVAR